MILMVSGRCDIVAFFTPWFIRRYEEEFVDVRNPFNPKLVSRILFDDVDAIMFCTKNPIPILPYLKKIDKPKLFHVTLTPYLTDIEPNVISKTKIIEAIKEVSRLVGKKYTYVRYDPIFVNEKYTISYHIKMFERLCKSLDGYVEHIIISFLDDYKNVRKNIKVLKPKELVQDDYKKIGENFSSIARKYHMTVQTCFEDQNLVEYGFVKGDCLGVELAKELTGKEKFKKWKARAGGKCSCVEMVDIGAYNTCSHFCKYCYANYDEKQVYQNLQKYQVQSSLLIGEVMEDDVIKIRK